MVRAGPARLEKKSPFYMSFILVAALSFASSDGPLVICHFFCCCFDKTICRLFVTASEWLCFELSSCLQGFKDSCWLLLRQTMISYL